jgi:hypothetical protein
MKDDYLWDGSGEPDPEIEHLEKVLGRYRYQPRQMSAALDQQLLPRRARWWPKLAVAAAIILMVLAAAWIVRQQQKGARNDQDFASNPPVQPQEHPRQESPRPIVPEPNRVSPEPKAPANNRATLARAPRRERKPAPQGQPRELEPAGGGGEVASVQPLMNPFVDVEIARHIERAQMLLRSFRNTRDTGDFDVAYERQRSRALLSQNAVLRRGAESKGNLPVGELLGSVEPFLLDIANLPDKPNSDDVRSIKARMQKKEIIAALQIYSAPTLSQAF